MNRFIAIVALLFIAMFAGMAQTDETDTREYAFSQEGRDNRTPEFTLRGTARFFNSDLVLTGGASIDRKRTLGLFAVPATTGERTTAEVFMFRKIWA